jgi:nucleotide-binding universal stress UspA family protein
MTLVVPFDGSELAALVRAAEFDSVLEESVLAVSVVPSGNESFARERGLLGADESYSEEAVVSELREQVSTLCPGAGFRHVAADRYARAGAVAKRVRRVAREAEASMVFIGSENAGRMVTTVSSVGASVAADDAYDVVIVRHRSPTKIAKLRDAASQEESISDFYDPE